MSEKITRVIIVEDHQLMMDGLVLLLSKEKDIELVGQARNGRKAIQLLNTENIDLAVIDITMPEMDGTELVKYMREHHPEIKILILTMHKKERYITNLASAGIDGYILKDNGQSEFVKAIREIVDKGHYYDQEIMHVLMNRMNQNHTSDSVEGIVELTQRETEVLSLIGKGYSSKEIAQKLFIAKSTVESHKTNVKEKLGLGGIKELIIYAVKNGYVDD